MLASAPFDSEVRVEGAANACELRNRDTSLHEANPSAKAGKERARPPRSRGSYFSLLHVATVVAPRTTDHLLSSTLTSVKQVGLLPFQLVQKPSLLSFHVPSPLTPAARLTGSRVILPSAMNTILNLMFDGVDEVNAWPLKHVSWT